jgi:hypothetical protein
VSEERDIIDFQSREKLTMTEDSIEEKVQQAISSQYNLPSQPFPMASETELVKASDIEHRDGSIL